MGARLGIRINSWSPKEAPGFYSLLLLQDEEDAVQGEPRCLTRRPGFLVLFCHRAPRGPDLLVGCECEGAVIVVEVDLLCADVLGANGDGQLQDAHPWIRARVRLRVQRFSRDGQV